MDFLLSSSQNNVMVPFVTMDEVLAMFTGVILSVDPECLIQKFAQNWLRFESIVSTCLQENNSKWAAIIFNIFNIVRFCS